MTSRPAPHPTTLPKLSGRGPLAALAVVVATGALIGFARLWTDWLWFHQLGFGRVFRTRLATGAALFLGFGLLAAAAVAGNLVLAHRLRPHRGAGAESLLAARTRALVGPRHRGARALAALAAALLVGTSAAGRRDLYLAWRHGTAFGISDPWFDRDVSFYVFALPWWRFVIAELFWVLGLATLVTAVAHFLNGSLRTFAVVTGPQGQPVVVRRRNDLRNPAQAQLSVLCALLLLLAAVRCWLDRYAYSVDDNWLFTGIGWTDLHARVVAKDVMTVILVIGAVVFLLNAWLRRWALPTITLVLTLLSSLLLQGIYPALVQRFDVAPKGPAKEVQYIAAHIAATRSAWGVDGVQITDDYAARTTATAGQLRADAEALPGIRLIDPALIAPTFEQLQQVRGYYAFAPVLDVDRYTIAGQRTDAVVAAREISRADIPDKSWTNLHTVYTHGYGMVSAYGNRRQGNGEPAWISRDIPTQGALAETQSRIYFGEMSDTYAVVGAPAGTAPVELDTPGGGSKGATETRNTYDGAGGVGIGNPLTRALYAIRFGDANLMLSTGRVNQASRILYDRQPRERVSAVAPWLTTDSDPYPAVVGGRVVWIVDGYTTSASYPNSARLDLRDTTSDATSGAQQSRVGVNYVRNSVKAVVDAYDGSVKLYAWDEGDPVLQTWQKVYPGLVQPRAAIPAALLQHLRYPTDLFELQRQVLGRYHTRNPETWFQQSDLWEVPSDPVTNTGEKEAANYLSIKWPGDATPVFSLTSTLVPRGRQNLSAYLAVDADAASKDYGKLRVLKLSDREQVDGPSQTHNAMNADTDVASKLMPYKQAGIQTQFGNLLTLPVGGGLLYVAPVYTQQKGSNGSYWVLRYVVVRFGDQIGIGTTLQQALDIVFKGDAGASTGEGTPSAPGGQQKPATGNAAARRYLAQAQAAFAAADAALRKGDLATYQRQVRLAQQRMTQAATALG